MKILIVDDNFVSRKLLKTILSEYGNCDLAESGKEAIQLFHQAHDSETPYDVICLDQMMPGMGGQEVLEEIRGFEEESQIDIEKAAKVLMVTALDDKQNILNSFRQGIEAYIIKPVEKAKIQEAIANLDLKL